MIYPSWRYHKTKEPVIVHSAEDEKALGKGWADTPAKFESDKKAEEKSDTYREHMASWESKEEKKAK